MLGPGLYLLTLTSGEFLELLKWAAIVGVSLGVAVGAYAVIKTRDRLQKAVARQVGADLLDDTSQPDPPPLPEHLRDIAHRLSAIPGQINTAILAAESRLGSRLQPLVEMDITLIRRMEDDRKAAQEHRDAIMRRIDGLGNRLVALEGQGGRQEARDLHREET